MSANSVVSTEPVKPVKEVEKSEIPERRLSATSPLNSPTLPFMPNKQWLSYTGHLTSVTDWKVCVLVKGLETFLLHPAFLRKAEKHS